MNKTEAYQFVLDHGKHSGRSLAWLALNDLPFLAMLGTYDRYLLDSSQEGLAAAVYRVCRDLKPRIDELKTGKLSPHSCGERKTNG